MLKYIHTTILFSLALNIFGQWNTSPTLNTPIVNMPKSQQNIHSISDTKNGAIIVWDDNRTNISTSTDIYAQRIKSDGSTKWLTGGKAICTSTATQKSNNIASGGVDGSAIITWEDGRAGNYDIYAQKIDSSGNVLWGANGIVVCNKATNQKNPKIVSDNFGGAIIVWEDSANFYFDVYAQRINSLGVAQWTANGVAVCIAPNQQQNPTLDIDGLGGAIITWQDKRSNVDYDIYAQQINSSGVFGWANNGIVICNAVNVQSNPKIEPDGNNGAIIGWVDKRNAIDYNIYSQRVNSAGAIQWTSNGVQVCGATNNQSALEMKYIGTAGTVYSWKDERVSFNQIYAQLLDLSGTPLLTTDGIQLSSGLKSINPNSIQDGAGGAIIAWQDSTTLGWDIKTQKLNSAGAIQWLIGGVTVSNASDDQTAVTQASDGTGGAIYAWEDRRNAADNEIYAHHLFYTGSELVGISELYKNNSSVLIYPNPAANFINFKIEGDNENNECNIELFDVLGNKLHTITSTVFQNTVTVSNLKLQNGLYFYTIKLGQINTTSGKFLISK